MNDALYDLELKIPPEWDRGLETQIRRAVTLTLAIPDMQDALRAGNALHGKPIRITMDATRDRPLPNGSVYEIADHSLVIDPRQICELAYVAENHEHLPKPPDVDVMIIPMTLNRVLAHEVGHAAHKDFFDNWKEFARDRLKASTDWPRVKAVFDAADPQNLPANVAREMKKYGFGDYGTFMQWLGEPPKFTAQEMYDRFEKPSIEFENKIMREYFDEPPSILTEDRFEHEHHQAFGYTSLRAATQGFTGKVTRDDPDSRGAGGRQ